MRPVSSSIKLFILLLPLAVLNFLFMDLVLVAYPISGDLRAERIPWEVLIVLLLAPILYKLVYQRGWKIADLAVFVMSLGVLVFLVSNIGEVYNYRWFDNATPKSIEVEVVDFYQNHHDMSGGPPEYKVSFKLASGKVYRMSLANIPSHIVHTDGFKSHPNQNP